jgi:hypothetical protein
MEALDWLVLEVPDALAAGVAGFIDLRVLG